MQIIEILRQGRGHACNSSTQKAEVISKLLWATYTLSQKRKWKEGRKEGREGRREGGRKIDYRGTQVKTQRI
jgi:hypothetical protein